MTPPVGTSKAPVLGLAEAAKACGVSESTIRRRRPELIAAGAVQDNRGWRIPVPALIELGLMDRTTAPDTPDTSDSPTAPGQGPVTTPATQTPLAPLLEALREKLADAEKRAAVAEAIAEERERIIAVQAQALRMLEAPRNAAKNTTQELPSEALSTDAGGVPTPGKVDTDLVRPKTPAPLRDRVKLRWQRLQQRI
ncbi:hypothetical protein [Arthrobacter sp. MAHUQ-56]